MLVVVQAQAVVVVLAHLRGAHVEHLEAAGLLVQANLDVEVALALVAEGDRRVDHPQPTGLLLRQSLVAPVSGLVPQVDVDRLTRLDLAERGRVLVGTGGKADPTDQDGSDEREVAQIALHAVLPSGYRMVS